MSVTESGAPCAFCLICEFDILILQMTQKRSGQPELPPAPQGLHDPGKAIQTLRAPVSHLESGDDHVRNG